MSDVLRPYAITKKLINDAGQCVDENLAGFAACNPGLKKLKDVRVIMRSDVDFADSNKVGLLSGGGAGHEPMFAGFVGKGALSAAVSGSVFTSPPPKHILTGLKAIQNQAGILVLIINYTGDRLNFGIAIERFQQLSTIPIKSVVIADDCALKSRDRSAGRRGLAGTLFVIKIAGALAEKGCSLDDIANEAQEVAKNTGTIGLSLSSCSLPDCPPMFQLEPNQMELGLGIHGEPGVKRIETQSARQTVEIMINHMIDSDSPTRLDIAKDDTVAVIVNNLGGTSEIEMGIVAKEVIRYLNVKEIRIKRIYVGSFMTSLEMHGVSISILKLKNHWLNLLDFPVNCRAWPNYNSSLLESAYEVDLKESQLVIPYQKEQQQHTVTCDKNLKVTQCLEVTCNRLIENEERLNQLDRYCGDGDCGSTLKRGCDAILRAMSDNKLNTACPFLMLSDLSSIWEDSTGGTAGAIYALFLSSAAKNLIHAEMSDVGKWLQALCSATDMIMHYGTARPGDRTMIDPLSSMRDLIRSHGDSPVDSVFLEKLIKVAENSAESTKNMKAKAGRASYVADSNLTHPDPGAAAVGIWIKSIISFVLENNLI